MTAPRRARSAWLLVGWMLRWSANVHRQTRELLNLVTDRLAHRDPFVLAELVAAITARRPMHDHLVNRRGRQQLPALALMAGLGALRAPRRILAPPRRAARRISAGRLRRVTRGPLDPTLQLRDSLLLLRDALLKPLDLLVHPQQHRHDHVPAPAVDRLGLSPLHPSRFAAPTLCPPTQLNAYRM